MRDVETQCFSVCRFKRTFNLHENIILILLILEGKPLFLEFQCPHSLEFNKNTLI